MTEGNWPWGSLSTYWPEGAAAHFTRHDPNDLVALLAAFYWIPFKGSVPSWPVRIDFTGWKKVDGLVIAASSAKMSLNQSIIDELKGRAASGETFGKEPYKANFEGLDAWVRQNDHWWLHNAINKAQDYRAHFKGTLQWVDNEDGTITYWYTGNATYYWLDTLDWNAWGEGSRDFAGQNLFNCVEGYLDIMNDKLFDRFFYFVMRMREPVKLSSTIKFTPVDPLLDP